MGGGSSRFGTALPRLYGAGCECPVVVASGEAKADESVEVEDGRPVVEPGVVLEVAAVGDVAVASGDEPGDGAFDGWSPAAVLVLPFKSEFSDFAFCFRRSNAEAAYDVDSVT